MAKKCMLWQHQDRLVRGGKRVECTVCGDSFPCQHSCDHADCKWEREVPGSVIQAELGFTVTTQD